MCVTTQGLAYKIAAFDIPECSRTALGAPLRELIPAISKDAAVAAVLPLRSYETTESLVLVTRNGQVKRMALKRLKYASLVTSTGDSR